MTKISFFTHIRSLRPQDRDLGDLIEGIRLGVWKTQVEACRAIQRTGKACGEAAEVREDTEASENACSPDGTEVSCPMKDVQSSGALPPISPALRKEYTRLKGLLPCFTLCRCEGGHAASHIVEYYGLVPLDFDHLPPCRVASLHRVARECPHTMAVFRTPSGYGLRIIVPTVCADPARHYVFWQRVRRYYEKRLGVPADEATKDPSRVSYVSYDPQAWWNPAALPFGEISPEAADVPQDLGYPATGVAEPESASLRCRRKLERYLALHPYPAKGGGRNNYLFRFALSVRHTGITASVLVALLAGRFEEEDFSRQEISQLVHSAFRDDRGEEVSLVSKVSPLSSVTGDLPTDCDPQETEESSGEGLRESTPCLYAGEKEPLPELISCTLFPFSNPRQRDVLLLTLLTSLGACMHQVTGVYGRRTVWPSLYTFVVAPAASGKGIMRWAEEVVTPYCDTIFEASLNARKQWKEELLHWEDRREVARRAKQECNEKAPEEPPVQSILVPSTLSRARLIDHVLKNQPYSSLIIDSEADSLSTASRADFGQFDHILRKFFEHEKTATSFKVDGEMKVIRNPRLSLSLTGTPAQLAGLITNYENGLQSRFLEYTFRYPLPQWEDMSPRGEYPDLGAYYAHQGQRVKEMLEWINREPVRVVLSESQWMRLNRTFRRLLTEVGMEEDAQLQAAVKRHGLMAFRVLMILSACRAWEEKNRLQEILCSEADFSTAIGLVTTCLKHSHLLSTSLKKELSELNELTVPEKMKQLLGLLPECFTFSQAAAAGEGLKLSRSAIYRFLKRARGFYVAYFPGEGYKQTGNSEISETSEILRSDSPLGETLICPDKS